MIIQHPERSGATAPHDGKVVSTHFRSKRIKRQGRGAAPVYWPIGSGFGERIAWTAQPAADARVRLSGANTSVVRLRADRAGPVLLSVRYLDPGRLPFTARLRLHPDLAAKEAAGEPVVVHKEQYDRVMNVLSELHPLGVEFDTQALRDHVLELAAGLADPFPAYTYPTYRGRRPAPAPVPPKDR